MAGSGTGTPASAVLATVSTDLWFPDVIQAAQLCPNPILRREIVNTCRDICARTYLWTDQLTSIDVVEDQAEYQLSISGAEISEVDRAQFNSKTIHPTSEMALDKDITQDGDYNEWRVKTTDIPERYFVTFEKKLRLVYIPDADLTGGLDVWVSLIPEITAIVVPTFLWENFKDLVADGTRGRLKSMIDMPWTDLQTATGFIQSYEAQMVAAKQKKFKGFQRVKTRAFVRTRYHDF